MTTDYTAYSITGGKTLYYRAPGRSFSCLVTIFGDVVHRIPDAKMKDLIDGWTAEGRIERTRAVPVASLARFASLRPFLSCVDPASGDSAELVPA